MAFSRGYMQFQKKLQKDGFKSTTCNNKSNNNNNKSIKIIIITFNKHT